jgi:hypothetical protein
MVKHNNTLAKAGNFRKNWQVRIEMDGGNELVWQEWRKERRRRWKRREGEYGGMLDQLGE